jgi:hypothetical protein
MKKELSYSEVVAEIDKKRKKLGIKLDPRNFLPVIRAEVKYKNGKK